MCEAAAEQAEPAHPLQEPEGLGIVPIERLAVELGALHPVGEVNGFYLASGHGEAQTGVDVHDTPAADFPAVAVDGHVANDEVPVAGELRLVELVDQTGHEPVV
ncbi:hypothetical protein [Streptomyces sp. NPDC001502]|uniref:hypothetical protein n=1 Tax=Streptomyces sp. NPDC001502 TaxID=3364578 RepID=UPI003696AE19